MEHTNQNNKMGIALAELIERHGFYVATDLDHTYQHSSNCHNSDKSTIAFTLSGGINNLTVKTREINNIQTRHKAIEIAIEKLRDKNRSHTPHFRTQGANWDEWYKLLDKNLSQFIASNRHKKRQSTANLNAVLKHKETLQNLMKDSKSKAYKKNSEFLNSSKDSTQFWHMYNKVFGTKKDNVIEPLYGNALNTYIFKDEDISNMFYNYHID